MMSQRTIGYLLWFPMFDSLDVAHARRRTQVIHDRVRLIESLRCEDMLIGNAFVLIRRRRPVAVKPDVMFPRDFAQSLIIRHCRSTSFKFGSTPHPPPLLFPKNERRPLLPAQAEIVAPFSVRLSPPRGED